MSREPARESRELAAVLALARRVRGADAAVQMASSRVRRQLRQWVAEPGQRVTVLGTAPEIGGGTGPDEREQLVAATRIREAQDRARELHRDLAALRPEEHQWKMIKAGLPPAASKAWDPDEATLLDKKIYRGVLEAVDPPQVTVRQIWSRYNRALQAAAAVTGTRAAPVVTRWVDSPAREQDVMIAPLRFIDSEPAFLAHLRFLLDESTLSSRTLHAQLAQAVPRAPGHSTLAGWLRGNKLPAQLSETLLRTIVELLADNIVGGSRGVSRAIAAEHVATYRMLLAARHSDALLSGPVARALAAIDEQEVRLDLHDSEDRIRFETLREVRERVLAELHADRVAKLPALSASG